MAHHQRLSRSLSQTLTLTHRLFSTGVAVKKVTRSNFPAALDDLRPLVRAADFVAVDLEMSGVTSAPWRESFAFDDSYVQYLKVKDSAEKFAVVQVGVCPFRWDPSRTAFVANPQNFYIFPRKELPVDGPSHEFLCQTSSVDFLAKHQFDFDAWVHDGISYLSREQELEALRIFSAAHDNKSSSANTVGPVEIPSGRITDILFTERMKNNFFEWRNDVLKGPPSISNPGLETTFFKLRPAVFLDGFNSHQHKLIQMVIRTYFRDLVYVHTNNENSFERRAAVVYSVSEDDKALLMKEVRAESFHVAKANIGQAVGFRHVIDLLSEEKKLIVGHSCILDVAQIYNKFYRPLPPTIIEFASSLHKYFPHIIDTKHLLKSNAIVQRIMEGKSKSLSSIFSLLCPEVSFSSSNSISAYQQRVKVEVPVGETGPSWNSGAKHEAGYDAFMTGCVFAQACSHLGIDFKSDPSVTFELAKNEKLQKHINLLYPNWKSDAVLDLTTGTEVPNSEAQHNKQRYRKIDTTRIVLLWGFSSKIKPSEFKDCITKVFGTDSVSSVFYLDESAAFIEFSERKLVTEFLVLKDTLERNDSVVLVLHPLGKILEGGKTHAADYSTYKEICSSSASKVMFADQAKAVGITWLTKVPSSNNVENQSPTSEKNVVGSENRGNTPFPSDGSYADDILDSFSTIQPLARRHASA